MKLLHNNKLSVTLFSVGNLSLKWWNNHCDFSFGKIIFAERRYVWYVHAYKLEMSYEQFRY